MSEKSDYLVIRNQSSWSAEKAGIEWWLSTRKSSWIETQEDHWMVGWGFGTGRDAGQVWVKGHELVCVAPDACWTRGVSASVLEGALGTEDKGDVNKACVYVCLKQAEPHTWQMEDTTTTGRSEAGQQTKFNWLQWMEIKRDGMSSLAPGFSPRSLPV